LLIIKNSLLESAYSLLGAGLTLVPSYSLFANVAFLKLCHFRSYRVEKAIIPSEVHLLLEECYDTTRY